ncbi:histidinol-phosphatase HisJ family protein [Intestinibacter sp.]|uniref:histidinol-phosphatase HisJ family protein n=1 Tax=Intestinibacter sp. TaxID=1965304 RepID=UPI003F18B490
MKIVDNHVHTHFSIDAKDTMEDVINKAIDIGVDCLTFTDHLEYNTDHFSLDIQKYTEQISKYKEKYKDDIELLTGIEVGYQSHLNKEINKILNSTRFDFVLCSTHTIDKIPVSHREYFEDLSKEEAYRKYFESILQTNKEFKNYDIYGHLDYINRYAIYEDNKIIYDDYRDILDEVLKAIIDGGKGIELNTSGYRYGLNAIHPNIDIVRRYKELGGEIITLGSDSHRAIDVCADFDKSYEMLDYLGFRYVSIFKNRKCEFIPIYQNIYHTA